METTESANIFQLIIIIGSIVIALAGIGAWYYEKKNERIMVAEIEKNKAEAENAKDQAAIANSEAAKANEKSISLELELVKTKKEVLIQKQKVAELQTIVHEEARKRAEAEAKLIELKNKLDWRHIDENIFIKTVQLPIKDKIEIIYKVDDNEAYSFAGEIRRILSKLGCVIDEFRGGNAGGADWPFSMVEGGILDTGNVGLTILYSEKEYPDKSFLNSPVMSLFEAFKACGIRPNLAVGYKEITPDVGHIKIVVDSRL